MSKRRDIARDGQDNVTPASFRFVIAMAMRFQIEGHEASTFVHLQTDDESVDRCDSFKTADCVSTVGKPPSMLPSAPVRPTNAPLSSTACQQCWNAARHFLRGSLLNRNAKDWQILVRFHC